MQTQIKTKIVLSFILLTFAASGALVVGNRSIQSEDNKSCQTNTQADLAKVLHVEKPIFLLDVRQPDEFIEQSLKDAVNIPLNQIEQRIAEIPKDKSIFVICRSGRRSAVATEMLLKNGYKDVKSLEGGMMKWNAEISHAKGCA